MGQKENYVSVGTIDYRIINDQFITNCSQTLIFEQLAYGGEVCTNGLEGEYGITTVRKLNASNIQPLAWSQQGESLELTAPLFRKAITGCVHFCCRTIPNLCLLGTST
jgi:hypothetical protein